TLPALRLDVVAQHRPTPVLQRPGVELLRTRCGDEHHLDRTRTRPGGRGPVDRGAGGESIHREGARSHLCGPRLRFPVMSRLPIAVAQTEYGAYPRLANRPPAHSELGRTGAQTENGNVVRTTSRRP